MNRAAKTILEKSLLDIADILTTIKDLMHILIYLYSTFCMYPKPYWLTELQAAAQSPCQYFR